MDQEFLEGLGLSPEAALQVLSQVEAMRQEQQAQLRQAQLDGALEAAVAAHGGRSGKAIRALLDEQALLSAEDLALAARQAVGRLKREHGYLFQSPQASGAGSARVAGYSLEELGSMSLAEYKRARRG